MLVKHMLYSLSFGARVVGAILLYSGDANDDDVLISDPDVRITALTTGPADIIFRFPQQCPAHSNLAYIHPDGADVYYYRHLISLRRRHLPVALCACILCVIYLIQSRRLIASY